MHHKQTRIKNIQKINVLWMGYFVAAEKY